MSTLILPTSTNNLNTVNELLNGSLKYETLRLKMLNNFNIRTEFALAETLVLFLNSSLCEHSYKFNGSNWIVDNVISTPNAKYNLALLYKELNTNFCNKVIDVIISDFDTESLNVNLSDDDKIVLKQKSGKLLEIKRKYAYIDIFQTFIKSLELLLMVNE